MSHEVGHGIAKHHDEQESWRMLITGTIFARLALTGMGPKKAVAAGYLASQLACHLYVDTFLSHQHEHEADLLGTAISMSAGCSYDDVVTGLARLHSRKLLAREKEVAATGRPAQERAFAFLLHLLPDIQLPNEIEDSKGLTAFVKSINEYLGMTPDKHPRIVRHCVDALWLSVAQRLQYTRSPYEALTGTHPHWLDRIAEIKKIRKSPDLNWCKGTMTADANDSMALQLGAYQASPAWPELVRLLTRVKGKSFADDFYSCKCIRSRTEQSLLLEVARQLSYTYDQKCQFYVFVKTALATGIDKVPHAAVQDWLIAKLIAADKLVQHS